MVTEKELNRLAVQRSFCGVIRGKEGILYAKISGGCIYPAILHG